MITVTPVVEVPASEVNVTYPLEFILDLQAEMNSLEKQIESLKQKLEELSKNTPEEEVVDSIVEEESLEVPIVDYTYDRLPLLPTNMFYCEPYSFGDNSDQKLLQQVCLTELETGMRYYTYEGEQYYCAALGNAYGKTIGDAWIVTLNNGYQFRVIRGDFKHDITVYDPFDFGDYCINYNEESAINVLEFIVDLEIMPFDIVQAGGVHKLDRFGGMYGDGGNIKSIEYIGTIWRR